MKQLLIMMASLTALFFATQMSPHQTEAALGQAPPFQIEVLNRPLPLQPLMQSKAYFDLR